MKTTAIKMLALGVAALAVLGGAVAIKNSCAAASTEGAKVSKETISELNDAARNLAQTAAKALEEAGVKPTDATKEKNAEEGNVGALGVSQSVPTPQKGAGALPWLIVLFGLAGGVLLVMTAFMKQYRPAPSEVNVEAAVDEIISRRTGQQPRQIRAVVKKVEKKARRGVANKRAQHDDFADISRAVDEIVAEHQGKK